MENDGVEQSRKRRPTSRADAEPSPIGGADGAATPPPESSDDGRTTVSGHRVDDGFGAVRDTYPPMLNTSQVAELLDLNPRTVLNMAGDGRLPASRLPGSRKFHFLLEDIIATLKANRIRS